MRDEQATAFLGRTWASKYTSASCSGDACAYSGRKAERQRAAAKASGLPGTGTAAPRSSGARHAGAAGTSPYLAITDSSAARSGGPPALTTAATSLKYCAPMSGDWTINARAVSAKGFENA